VLRDFAKKRHFPSTPNWAPFPLGDDLEVTLPAEMMLKVEDPKPLFVKIMNRISQSPTLGKFIFMCIFITLLRDNFKKAFLFEGLVQLQKNSRFYYFEIIKKIFISRTRTTLKKSRFYF
jgi:hypothetical protein